MPAGAVDREIYVKKSRFIVWLRCVRSRDEGLKVLEQARAQYPDASHHCYAWLIGAPSNGQGAMNDDGEPSGTAGKPIFNVIRHKNIGDVMVVVTRYFGGVKLGAGGLIRAYAAGAEAVLSAMDVTEHVPRMAVDLELDFAQEQPLRHWCQQHGAEVEGIYYGQPVTARIIVRQDSFEAFTVFCTANKIQLIAKYE